MESVAPVVLSGNCQGGESDESPGEPDAPGVPGDVEAPGEPDVPGDSLSVPLHAAANDRINASAMTMQSIFFISFPPNCFKLLDTGKQERLYFSK